MNRIFNLIWSATKERLIVVSEKVKGNGKVPSSPLRSLAVLMALFATGEPEVQLAITQMVEATETNSGCSQSSLSELKLFLF